MPATYTEENGVERCYINAAPSAEHCQSISRYFAKYWDASVELEHDVGFAAKYVMRIGSQTVFLCHDSQIGNYLYADDARVSVILADAITDLDRRLG